MVRLCNMLLEISAIRHQANGKTYLFRKRERERENALKYDHLNTVSHLFAGMSFVYTSKAFDVCWFLSYQQTIHVYLRRSPSCLLTSALSFSVRLPRYVSASDSPSVFFLSLPRTWWLCQAPVFCLSIYKPFFFNPAFFHPVFARSIIFLPVLSTLILFRLVFSHYVCFFHVDIVYLLACPPGLQYCCETFARWMKINIRFLAASVFWWEK